MKKSYWYSVRDYLPETKDNVVVRGIDIEDSDHYFMAFYSKDHGWRSIDENYRKGFIVTDWTVPPFMGYLNINK